MIIKEQNKTEVVRTFHPVGHGAFYTEQINNDFVIAYDCGGKLSLIDEILSRKDFPNIDIVFVSHLHNDHINGLRTLLEKCNVKKVFLPLLSNAMKLWFVVENAKYYENDDLDYVNMLTINPEEVLGDRLVFVEEYDDDHQNADSLDISLQNIETIRTIKSGTKLIKDGWVYIPVNLTFDKYAKKLKEVLHNKGIDCSNICAEIKKDGIKNKIMEAYKEVLGDSKNFNANSMVFYSGSLSNTDFLMETRQTSKRILNRKVGCLYLGDLEVKRKNVLLSLKRAYKDAWDTLSTIQIPHHGSCHNYHPCLFWEGSISLVSARPSQHHPSYSVLNEVGKMGAELFLVTEALATKTKQSILPLPDMQNVSVLDNSGEILLVSRRQREQIQEKFPEWLI